MSGRGPGSPLPCPIPVEPWGKGTGGDEPSKAFLAEKPMFVSCSKCVVSRASSGTETVPGCAKGLCEDY